MNKPWFDQLHLMSILSYNPHSGEWTWISCPGKNKSFRNGKMAGSVRRIRGRPYNVIQIYKTSYASSRLAWLYMNGTWPEHCIDHSNCNSLDDRWGNLRLATVSENNANRRSPKHKKSNLPKGVYDVGRKLKKRYQASITVNKKTIYLGMHDTPDAAHEAYKKAANNFFGQFARTYD